MPNWCGNVIYMTGPQEVLTRLVDEVEASGSFIETVDPIIDPFANIRAAVKRWGTKWADGGSTASLEDGVATIYLDTAWSPPIEAIATAAGKYGCSATFAWWEGGVESYGVGVVDGGNIVVEERNFSPVCEVTPENDPDGCWDEWIIQEQDFIRELQTEALDRLPRN